MEQLLLRELERLEAKRREIDRELDTLRVLRNETAVAALRGQAVTEHLRHAETQAQLPVT